MNTKTNSEVLTALVTLGGTCTKPSHYNSREDMFRAEVVFTGRPEWRLVCRTMESRPAGRDRESTQFITKEGRLTVDLVLGVAR